MRVELDVFQFVVPDASRDSACIPEPVAQGYVVEMYSRVVQVEIAGCAVRHIGECYPELRVIYSGVFTRYFQRIRRS